MIKIPDSDLMPNEGGLTWTARSLFVEGYRKERFDLMISHLSKFETAVEVGAHIGSWTIGLAAKFKMVLAYEPNPKSFKLLSQNVTESGFQNILLKNLAVGDYDGEVNMSEGPKGPISSKVDPTGSMKIKMRSLDSEKLGKISLLKIHCNGHELEVIKGSVRLILESAPEIFIVIKKNKNVTHDTQDELLKFLKYLGYVVKYSKKPDWLFTPKEAC